MQQAKPVKLEALRARARARTAVVVLAFVQVIQLVQACAFESPVNVEAPDAGRPSAPATPTSDAMPAAVSDAGTSATSTLNAEQIFASKCAMKTDQAPLLPSNLLFVIDRSGSMTCNPPPTTPSDVCERNEQRDDPNQPSKWVLTSNAVSAAIRSLPDTAAVGMSYFNNDGLCGVSPLPAVSVSRNTMGQRTVIASTLATLSAAPPSGSTPLVGATLLAYEYLHNAALSGAITGNSYVVLITDGQQSDACSDPKQCDDAEECSELLIQKATIASGPGVNIRTFVIGVPGSEVGRTVLSRLAKAGGTARPGCVPEQGDCHFDVTSAADLSSGLQTALQSIAGQTLTCDLDVSGLDAGTLDLTRLNVVFTPHEGRARVIPASLQLPCDGGADGWQYDSAKNVIRLCGNNCTSVRNDRGGRIDVVLGCPVIGPD